MSVNKARCSVNAVVWTPEGRRCLSATAGGEFTLWNGATFGFATILQAHESPIRAARFSHNDNWMLSCDDAGAVKYWRPNLELVKAIPAHREPVRALAFAPTDLKFATASDDATVRIWDFARCASDVTLAGHGGDAKAVDWHATLGLVASGAKDSLVKLWDPRAKSSGGSVVSSAPSAASAAAAAPSSSSGGSLASLSGHTAAITAVAFAPHAPHWLLSCSRDSTARLVDIRTLRTLATLAGHGRDVTCCAWHPWSPGVVATGAYDGGMAFWDVTAGDVEKGGGGGAESQPAAARAAAASSGAFAGKGRSAAAGSSPPPIAMVPGAHEASLWAIAWHPAGHLAATAGHDHCTRFWARPRPGDPWRGSGQRDLLASGVAARAEGGAVARGSRAAAVSSAASLSTEELGAGALGGGGGLPGLGGGGGGGLGGGLGGGGIGGMPLPAAGVASASSDPRGSAHPSYNNPPANPYQQQRPWVPRGGGGAGDGEGGRGRGRWGGGRGRGDGDGGGDGGDFGGGGFRGRGRGGGRGRFGGGRFSSEYNNQQ